MIPQLVGQQLALVRAPKLTKYRTALESACETSPPPFGLAWYGDLYRECAADLEWLARSLIENAEKEAFGSSKLWEFAGRISDPEVSEAVRRHAVDESRHAKYYISLLQLAFPKCATPEEFSRLKAISPGYRRSDVPPRTKGAAYLSVLDELIQMNIGEIRTLVNQLLMAPVLELVCPESNRERLRKLLDSLRNDERLHILYTARLVEGASIKHENFVQETMSSRLAEFSQITKEEVGVG
jgi:rubrerythrin